MIAGDGMVDGTRSALIVASSDYADPQLRRLQAPASDARALETVLHDPGIGGFEVRTLLNKPAHEVNLAVEEFFADRQPDDLLLLHFSCHGVKDEDGDLYFAMADTLLRRLAATAVAADFVNRRMSRSRSKRVVLLLDCCNAGAFERGMTARAGGGMGIETQFGGGRGRAVITATNAMEYSFEGGELTATGEVAPSVFTSALVNGLETGEADRDQDGMIALDELYNYVYDKVRAATPNQTPCKWLYGVQGELVIARRSHPVTTPAPLPGHLQVLIENPLASARAGAVKELEPLLRGKHQGLALAARLTLEKLTSDDSRTVAAAAIAALGIEEPRLVPPRLEPSTKSVDFGPLTHRSQSPERSIRLGNAGGGSLNAHAATQASWIRLRQAGDELCVAVDTGAVGEHEGTVTVDSDGGSATIVVKAGIVPAPQPAPEIPASAEAAPAVDRSTRSDPQQDTASVKGQPVPARARPAAETIPHPAHGARSGAARLLDAGFIILIILLCIIALDILIPRRTFLPWPWWAIFAASILGIAVTLGAVRQYTVPAGILLWTMAWSAIYSISIVGFSHSSIPTAITALSTECIIAAVVSAALCIWIVVLLSKDTRNVDPFLAIFIGCFSVAYALAAIAIRTGKPQGGVWNAVGAVTFAAALGVLLALIRAHRPGMTSS